jgi:hypothetical protein
MGADYQGGEHYFVIGAVTFVTWHSDGSARSGSRPFVAMPPRSLAPA